MKEAEEDAQKLLQDIMNDAYGLDILPQEWQKGVINPTFKRGDKVLCEKKTEEFHFCLNVGKFSAA